MDEWHFLPFFALASGLCGRGMFRNCLAGLRGAQPGPHRPLRWFFGSASPLSA
jgi:hypothetical protein